VERALGVLKTRFLILKVATLHMLENQVKIPIVAAIFHNLIRLLHGDEEWLEHQPHNIHLANFVDLPDGDENNDSARVGKGSPKVTYDCKWLAKVT